MTTEVIRGHDFYGATWRTRDELAFLSMLGEHHNSIAYNKKFGRALRASDRIKLLRAYVVSMELRTIWRNLDRVKIRRHAEKLIRSYEALSSKGSNAKHQ
jgi:hypothetical protein